MANGTLLLLASFHKHHQRNLKAMQELMISSHFVLKYLLLSEKLYNNSSFCGKKQLLPSSNNSYKCPFHKYVILLFFFQNPIPQYYFSKSLESKDFSVFQFLQDNLFLLKGYLYCLILRNSYWSICVWGFHWQLLDQPFVYKVAPFVVFFFCCWNCNIFFSFVSLEIEKWYKLKEQ